MSWNRSPIGWVRTVRYLRRNHLMKLSCLLGYAPEKISPQSIPGMCRWSLAPQGGKVHTDKNLTFLLSRTGNI